MGRGEWFLMVPCWMNHAESKPHGRVRYVVCFLGHHGSDPSWLWINTYENTIFRGMNIHKSQLF